ncbi:MAG: inorganic phosphate transporter [Prevotellaceae bacterium]|jgi:phosphate/sulfate permease|nr:inorganic phosphate transporter [Prevotellaceae bacterium]
MESFYLAILLFIFITAIFDIMVGVSNDAVNFLNSAVGSKAAPFKMVMTIAAIGIFIGASLSNGMMDIARHGIYQPQNFYFEEILFICLAVMMTDIILLDTFNSLGLPTSTTVSMVFELLGATFAISLLKIQQDPLLSMGDLINTDKALSVIIAIFLSVAIAFTFGTIVQYIARLVFTFNYEKRMKYSIGLFGGIAATSIIYFMLIKGLKDSSFMTPDNKEWLQEHTMAIVSWCFIGFTLLMQFLHWIKINVFKVIVLMGTFALALAFAGNDLVNFIGVPMASYSAYTDYVANIPAGATPDTFLMTSLTGSASTPWYFLVGAGAVMVYALFTSKKAHRVIKTSVDLSRQDEGDELFGSTPMARTLVRMSLNVSTNVANLIPEGMKRWADSRFRKDEAIIANGAAFDLVRASVNLVIAGLLIALGTSWKLPLSTTYVTFMVAMGSSLADRAWGRDSAVFRITGVLSVVGGWFLTAGSAFVLCFLVALLIHFGGIVSIVALTALGITLLIRSQMRFRRKQQEQQEKETTTALQLRITSDPQELLFYMRKYTRERLCHLFIFVENNFEKLIDSFFTENLRGLRQVKGSIKLEKKLLKQVRREGIAYLSRMDTNVLIEKGLFYHQGIDFATDMVVALNNICEPALEHIDNNFAPLLQSQKNEFRTVTERVLKLIQSCREKLVANEYDEMREDIRAATVLNNQLAAIKREEFRRVRSQNNSIKISLVYLTILQETQNIVNYTINSLKIAVRFQSEEDEEE